MAFYVIRWFAHNLLADSVPAPLSTTYNQRLPKELLHVFERFSRKREIAHRLFPLHW